MASKNPIGRLADSAIKSLRDPVGTAGKVVEQAKGTASLGRTVAEQVGKSALSRATETAGAVVGRAKGRTSPHKAADAPRAEAHTTLRSVPDVNEAGHTPAENKPTDSGKKQGDPLRPVTKAPAKKGAAKQAPAAKKAAAKPTAKKAATPADVARTVEAAVAEDPKKTAATPVKKAAAKKTAKKSPAKKSAPGDKLPIRKSADTGPAKKATAKKAPAKKAAPRSTEELAYGEGGDVTTPAGTPAAGPGSNPDTTESGLNQPGTEGIVEDATAKAIAKKTATLRKAAEQNPE